MAPKSHSLSTVFVLFSSLIFLFPGVVFPANFTFVNQCGYTVCPGIVTKSNAIAAAGQLSTTGFALNSGESFNVSLPASCSGRMWVRTHNSTTGNFTCLTGDCGSGGGAAPPATVAEFTLNSADGLDFYVVSHVNGSNVPMLVVPQGGGDCTITGSVADLNMNCPRELKLVITGDTGGDRGSNKAGDTRNNTGDTSRDGDIKGQLVACRSACGDPDYYCSGKYVTPDACKQSVYPKLFKNACPPAYSYVYHNSTITFSCPAADYVMITFCPIR